METLDRVKIDKVVNKSYISYILWKPCYHVLMYLLLWKFVSFMNLSAFSKIMKKYEKVRIVLRTCELQQYIGLRTVTRFVYFILFFQYLLKKECIKRSFISIHESSG
jgi:hypothetical protein